MRFLIFLMVVGGNIFIFSQENSSTTTKNVSVISEKFEVPQLNTTRRIWIYLPPDYHLNKKKFPVMYLQDGQNCLVLK